MFDLQANPGSALQQFGQFFGGDVEKMEGFMLTHEQASCPVIHRFGPGVYIREVMIPAGTLAVGHHQNFEHTNVMLKGRVTILNDDGTTTELIAPTIFVGKPGRKVGYIHEDIVWLNVYATDETDVEKLESTFITKSDTWSAGQIEDKIKLLQHHSDRDDYDQMLTDLGVTEQIVRSQSENTQDMTSLPHGSYKIKVGPSKIEGNGLFATAAIASGEVIAPARIDGLRTIAGRFTNHSSRPNAMMARASGSDINLVAIQDIEGCRGGLDGDEITIDYRQAYELTMEIGLEDVSCQQ